MCRTPSHATTCAKADGTRCVACKTGGIPFDALTCVAEGDCVEFVDGACVRCKDGMFPEDGKCVASGSCKVIGNGPFQRCKDEMLLAAQTGRCVESDLVGRETEVRGICLRVTRDVLCV